MDLLLLINHDDRPFANVGTFYVESMRVPALVLSASVGRDLVAYFASVDGVVASSVRTGDIRLTIWRQETLAPWDTKPPSSYFLLCLPLLVVLAVSAIGHFIECKPWRCESP